MMRGMARRFERVAVLLGGISEERDVSLRSGEAVAAGLREAGYVVAEVDVTSRAVDLPEGTEAVFLALHGAFGEDGGIQEILRRRGIPYTGSGPEASRLAFDKALSRERFRAGGIPVPPGQVLRGPVPEPPRPLPLVIKPARQGSSVGCRHVVEPEDWIPAQEEAFRYGPEAVVEAYIEGAELTVGIVGEDAMPVIEILAPNGRYDLAAKYTEGLTEYRVPAPLPAGETAAAQDLAGRAYRALGCRGLGRADMRRHPDGRLFVLEVNTIPGFTRTSLLPKAAAAAGMTFSGLCDRVLNLASV